MTPSELELIQVIDGKVTTLCNQVSQMNNTLTSSLINNAELKSRIDILESKEHKKEQHTWNWTNAIIAGMSMIAFVISACTSYALLNK